MDVAIRSAPAVRPEAFDIYWNFASERQRIFEARAAGTPGPWTEDPILLRYKFCNVYRAADRVSQHLIRAVAYGDDDAPALDRAFQIVLHRTFSRPSTWEALVSAIGRSPRIEDLESGAIERELTTLRQGGEKLYTGAFILCATDAYGRRIKHLNHVEMLREIFVRTSGGERLRDARSLRELYTILHEYPLMGDFMSYQIAVDLNYSDLYDFSEDEFTQPGPGAHRGLRKVFLSTAGWTPADLIKWMVDRQEEEFTRRGLRFNGLYGRRIHAIDAQNLLCEVDKYCRVALPELASARTRIKSTFTAHPARLDLFFPPKWGISAEGSRSSS